jgi:hypothetical protein
LAFAGMPAIPHLELHSCILDPQTLQEWQCDGAHDVNSGVKLIIGHALQDN